MIFNPNLYSFLSISIILTILTIALSHYNVPKLLRESVAYSMYYIYGISLFLLNDYYLLSLNYYVKTESYSLYSVKILVFLLICFGSPRIYDSMWNIFCYKPNYMRLCVLLYNGILFSFAYKLLELPQTIPLFKTIFRAFFG